MKHYFSLLPKAGWKGGKCRTMEHKWVCETAEECVQDQPIVTARGTTRTSFLRRSSLSITRDAFEIPSIGAKPQHLVVEMIFHIQPR